jgi:flagellar biosynthesis/type III secretory pathway protein FliH
VADFVPLGEWLRAPGRTGSEDLPAQAAPAEPAAELSARAESAERAAEPLEALGLELAILRAAACESFENAVRRLLVRLARDVLGRELALAPCDLAALVAAARGKIDLHRPLRLVTAPAERAEFPAEYGRRSDPSLAPGDLVVEVSDGAFDATLSARLQRALEGLGE